MCGELLELQHIHIMQDFFPPEMLGPDGRVIQQDEQQESSNEQ